MKLFISFCCRIPVLLTLNMKVSLKMDSGSMKEEKQAV